MGNRSSIEAWKGYPLRHHLKKAPHAYSSEWKYLASVERNQLCGGFCEPGPMLWTSIEETGRQGGKCAPYVAIKMLVIAHEGGVVMMMGFIILVIAFLLYFALGRWMKRIGFK